MNSPREPVTGRLPESRTSVQRQKHSHLAFSEGLPSERNRSTKAQCMFTDSTWYAWYLMCEILCRPEYSSLMAYKLNKSYVRHETKKDLASLCLVSKAMNDLATAFLYRSLSFEMAEDTLVGNAGALLYRLLDTSHDSPRCFVREITISPVHCIHHSALRYDAPMDNGHRQTAFIPVDTVPPEPASSEV